MHVHTSGEHAISYVRQWHHTDIPARVYFTRDLREDKSCSLNHRLKNARFFTRLCVAYGVARVYCSGVAIALGLASYVRLGTWGKLLSSGLIPVRCFMACILTRDPLHILLQESPLHPARGNFRCGNGVEKNNAFCIPCCPSTN